MVAIVHYQNANVLARKYLLQGLSEHGVTGIAVGTKLPSPMQVRFIKLFTIPGREVSRRTKWCTVIAQVYDGKGNDIRCMDLAELCGEVLRSAPDMEVDGEQWVSEPCELNGPYESEDPDLMGVPRCQVNVVWTLQSSVTE